MVGTNMEKEEVSDSEESKHEDKEEVRMPVFLREQEEKPKKIRQQCKYYGHGLPCLWKLRGRFCRCVHCPILKEAYDLLTRY